MNRKKRSISGSKYLLNGYKNSYYSVIIMCLIFLMWHNSAHSLAAQGGSTDNHVPTVRIMTYNIRMSLTDVGKPEGWIMRKPGVLEEIKGANCDFIGIQEACLTPFLPLNQVYALKNAFPEYGIWMRSREKNLSYGEGTPILYLKSRWEIDPEQQGFFWLSESPDVPASKSWNSACTRILLWARFYELSKVKDDPKGVRRTGRAIYVFNTHLDHVSDMARRQGIILIMKFIAQRTHKSDPVILTGDFNCSEKNDVIRYLSGNLLKTDSSSHKTPLIMRDVFTEIHPNKDPSKIHYTMNNFRKPLDKFPRIDYIFVLGMGKTRSAEIIYTEKRNGIYPSDHFPVVAEVELLPPI